MINRQKLIEDMKRKCVGNCLKCEHFTILSSDYHCGVIDDQPPADQWIPCSEREPEDPCIYTVEDCSLYTVNKFGSPQRYVWKVLPPMFGTNYRLVAWKPVDPEPYKGVE